MDLQRAHAVKQQPSAASDISIMAAKSGERLALAPLNRQSSLSDAGLKGGALVCLRLSKRLSDAQLRRVAHSCLRCVRLGLSCRKHTSPHIS